MCPHADEEGRIESSKGHLKNLNKKGLILSNCSALIILDNNYKVLKSSDDAFINLAYYIENEFVERTLDCEGKIEEL